MVSQRTLLALILAGVGVFTRVFQPEPLRTLVLVDNIRSTVFYVTLITLVLILILWRGKPEEVDPTNKAVLITGCDSGFGRSLAQKLDSHGFTVFAGCLFADRDDAQQLKKSCSERTHLVQLDITDDWQVRKAREYVTNNLGNNVLWAVVNNAGIAVFTEIEWCSVSQFQRVMDVNVIGTVRVTKAFLPLVRETKGRIINVASLAGRFTIPAFTAYSMSKKACIGFSDGLRQEMDKFGVKVITVEPSLYKTPIAHEDYLIDMNRKSWAETPTEIKNVYGEEYFDAFLENIKQQMKRARSNVSEVVDQLVCAVSSKEPKIRYVPYWVSNVRVAILTALPTTVTDRLFKSYTVPLNRAVRPKT